jgi:ATP phosphoribosyltransferase regulatory subunit
MVRLRNYLPEGFQDFLLRECYEKRILEEKIRKLFIKNAYDEVETSTVEFYDAFNDQKDYFSSESMFKFFDPQGRILVLRPDMTVPVSRVVATKLSDLSMPLRLSYIGNVFRYNEKNSYNMKEITQSGIELVGVNNPYADAEVIGIAIEALLKLGIKEFQIDIGQVEVFKSLMAEANFTQNEIENIRDLIDKKDTFALEMLIKDQKIEENLKYLIMNLPSFYGSLEVISKTKSLTKNRKLLEVLGYLETVIDILSSSSYEKYISIDLGMVKRINYYSGIIFRGYTNGVGHTIISGGRYDDLIENSEKKIPAIGFSLSINSIITVLERQNVVIDSEEKKVLIGYHPNSRELAFGLCKKLRDEGLWVELDILNRTISDLTKVSQAKKIKETIYFDENKKRINLGLG